jgi:paraquat-inducible protein A
MSTAARRGLLLCPSCFQLNRPAAGAAGCGCARCGTRLHFRKPASIARTWAFVIAACVLYVPANVFPVIDSSSLAGTQVDTIFSGAVYLWNTGSWLLATIVFVASIVVPAAKLGSLALLLVTAQRRSRWRPAERSRLYRFTEYIGRWSMVDIYVGGVLVALVQLHPFASVEPGPGVIYFGAVVVLTMFASSSFDPRLIWDPVDE